MSEALVERLREADTNSQQRVLGSRIFGEAADRIEALEREVKELRAEAKEHKRLKNELVLKAYPAMDAIDEIAEGFRSAVHFVRNNAMNMERDYPEICHAEEVFSRARAALSGSGSGWRMVPYLWQCKDYADGWLSYANEDEAQAYQRDTGCAVRITYRPLPAAPLQGGE